MSLETFTLFQYGKKGEPTEVDRARKIVANTKACRFDFLNNYFNSFITDSNKNKLAEFIPPTATLIPIPKSAPMLDGAQWPPKEICKFLLNRGYGDCAIELLKRIKVVPKAAFQKTSEERPSVELHCKTIKFQKSEIYSSAISQIILVDDVITQGRTAYACYKTIREFLPNTPISLFCLIRTFTFNDLVKSDNPKRGEITYNNDSGKTFYKDIDTNFTGRLFD